jgi:integrase/recombinase XerD
VIVSSRSGVRVAGPLAAFAPGFVEDLVGRGYRPGPAADQLRLMADVSRWLAERGLGAGDLTVLTAERFSAERRASGRARFVSARALRPLLDYLADRGVAPVEEVAAPLSASDVLIERYSMYLLERRGLAPSSVRNYVGVARVFLADREQVRGELALTELDGSAISEFVLRESRRSSVGSAKCMVTRLRALLRFLHVEGEIEQDLAGAVPSVASWRLASLVKALDARSVARLLSSCDRRTRVGRRDFAILTVLSRLGLRAGEVAAVQLGDVDWRAGDVLVRGKGSREERLPLPADVGEALAGWLARGRPRCESVFVFTRLRAPHGGLSAGAVSQIVRRACQRAGLPAVGAHRLRHTAATEMLRAGGSLTEVGQVLRHRGRDVTSIYAKVDRLALAAVVAPWPGAAA